MSAPEEPRPARTPLSSPTGRADDPRWLTRRGELALYLAAGVSYVGLAMFHKFLLNWIIGPLWLVAWVWLVPTLLEGARRVVVPEDR
jgi:hypothetical protein